MSQDEELEALRTGVSCAVLLERHPPTWQLDKRESTRNCLKYRRGEGEIILVTHQGRGWWDPGSTAKGDVFTLAQRLEPGLNFGQVRKLLRPLAGLVPTFPEHLRKGSREKPVVSVNTRWDRRRAPAYDSPCWRYLADERRLPQAILVSAIQAGVLREGPSASAWFAHHDHAGRLTGIEMRGPDFRGFSPGGDKSLFRLPGRPAIGMPVLRLVAAEAPIDALSLAAIEESRGDSLYVATAGGMGPETIRALELCLEEPRSSFLAPCWWRRLTLIAPATATPVGCKAMAETARGALREDFGRPRKDWNEALQAGEGEHETGSRLGSSPVGQAPQTC